MIRMLLEKEPDKRPQSASEVARRLQDITRTIREAASATRDLGTLVDESFPAGSFDIDAKVREALAVIEAEGGPEPEIEPTSIEPTPSGEVGDMQVFVGSPGTNAIWPTTSASDPLAPEALQEQLALMGGMSGMAGAAMLQTPSYGSADFSMSRSAMLAIAKKKRNSQIGIAVAACAAALLVVLAVVSLKGAASTDVSAPASNPIGQEGLRVTQGASAPQAASPSKPPETNSLAGAGPETPQPEEPLRPHRRLPTRTKAPSETAPALTANPSGPAQAEPPAKASPPSVDTSNPKAISGAIKTRLKRLTEINGDEGKKLMAKYSELVALDADANSLAQFLGEVNEAVHRNEKR
jgi:hypothetical protein